MSKQKYTIYLKNNNSKIVLTDTNPETEEEVITNIKKLMNSSNTGVFQTKTDLIFIKSSNIEAIHVSLEEITQEPLIDDSDLFEDENELNDEYIETLNKVHSEVFENNEVEEDTVEFDGEDLNDENLLNEFEEIYDEYDEEEKDIVNEVEEEKEESDNVND